MDIKENKIVIREENYEHEIWYERKDRLKIHNNR